MILCVASGKGGTGKTTISTSLASVLGAEAQLMDCDVEEPNCHILMKPEIRRSVKIGLPVPEVNAKLCTACGECGEICRFSAIIMLADQVLTFPHMCHGCGGCSLLCPEKAIREVDRELGFVELGYAGEVEFAHGLLRVGEAMSPPLIKALKKHINPEKFVILDAPPGASCPVITTAMGSDFIILVTEPTPFGLHDLRIAVRAISELEIPYGVVVNRSDIGDDSVGEFCRSKGIPLLMEIPHSRAIAEGYSKGNLLIDSEPAYRDRFIELKNNVERLAGNTHSVTKEAFV